MINRRFLNFKTYNAFIDKLNNHEIDTDNAIVFVQDKSCIWAHGKEYICNGPDSTDIINGTLTFKNSNDDSAVFTITQHGGTLEFRDSSGNTSSATYILKAGFDDTINSITNWITRLLNDSQNYLSRGDLKNVAFTADYGDLINTPTIPLVISQLSSESHDPVESRAIYEELNKKADASELSLYVSSTTYNAGLNTKQDKLSAGKGISSEALNRNVIESTIDTSVYVIVTSLPDPAEADPNKIYIRETLTGPDTYIYEQFRVNNEQWVLIGQVSPDVDLHGYLTFLEAEGIYQHIIDDYLTSADLTPYAKLTDIRDLRGDLSNYALISYVNDNFFTKGAYTAFRTYIEDTFVKKVEVYHPKQNDWESDDISGTIDPSNPIVINPVNIVLDRELSLSSQNGVLNWVIKQALDNKLDLDALDDYATKALLATKANASDLQNYVQNNALEVALLDKLDVLTPGDGISIINNVISCTLDNSVYLFVDAFPSGNDIDQNKIYILEEEDNGETIYTLYKYRAGDGEWVSIGQVTPEVDLTAYLRSDTAASTYLSKSEASTTYQEKGNYQPAGNYALSTELTEAIQTITNMILRGYVDNTTLLAFMLNIENSYQHKGGYALASDVTEALTTLQQLIDLNYVLKRDVYNPLNNEWSTNDPTQITVGASGGDGQGGNGSQGGSNMVTLTVAQYDALVLNNMVNPNTYYFTYEEEPEVTWGFGGNFPITLSGDDWKFGDNFPITLTDQWTFGRAFPINLT